MKDAIRLIKTSGVYFIGGALSKLCAFVMLPVYTASIDPAAYGAYDEGLALAAFFGSVLYLDIWNGILRFMYDFARERDKLRPAASGMLVFAVSSALFCAAMAVTARVVPLPFVGLLCLYGVLQNLQQTAGAVTRGYGKGTRFMAAGVVGALCTAVTGFVLLRAGMGVRALYLSQCIGFVVATAVHLGGVPWPGKGALRVDRALLRGLIAFCAPLCLNSVAYWCLTAYNRVAVARLLSPFDNGLYAVAGKFGLAALMLAQCAQMAWQELAFGKASLPDAERGAFFSRAAGAYLRALALSFAVLLPCVKLLFPLMVDAAYHGAEALIAPYMLAMLLSSLCSFLSSIFGALKRTRSLFVNMAVGAVVNVACFHMIVGTLGVHAAALAMCLGFSATACMHLLRLRRLLGLRIRLRDACAALLVIGSAWLCSRAFGMLGNAVLPPIVLCAAGFIHRKQLGALLRAFARKNHA